MEQRKYTILIADDHPIVVDGLKEILKSYPNYDVVNTANDGQSVLLRLAEKPVDIIIMDINMPRMDGIACTREVKKKYADTKIIILTMYNERAFVNELINAGADGCILKSKGSSELIVALERVTGERSYFDSVSDFTSSEVKRKEYNLSEREIEIIKHVIEGKTSAEIADQLFISEHTVKTHRKNIMRKLEINNASQLAAFAINHGIVK